MSDIVQVEHTGDIAIVRLNRPDRLYALSITLAGDIAATLIELDNDDAGHGIVLTGAGDRAFCAGVDLQEAHSMHSAVIESWFGTSCNTCGYVCTWESKSDANSYSY